MAGAGYKLFNTGDVLTAAQVNTYLMEQTVMVFANAAARTTALSGVVSEGMISYLKDTNAVEVYDGSNWVSSDDPNAIQNTIVDAKGDLIAASAADTPARLAVGNNGETLVADSSTSTGLRYTAGNAVGNPVLNSAFQVWQRGTSFSFNNEAFYTADRWYGYSAGSGRTISRQTTGDTTNLPNIQYCARIQRTNGNTATNDMQFFQPFETVNAIPYAGKTVTLSFYARKGANYSPSVTDGLVAQVISGTGTDQNPINGYTGQATVAGTTVTLTTTWQRFSITGTIAATATEFFIRFRVGGEAWTGTAGANDYYEVTGVQLDIGSVALPFRTYAATLAGERSACERYYWKDSSAVYEMFINNTNDNLRRLTVSNPTTMRANGSYTITMDSGSATVDSITPRSARVYISKGNTTSTAYFTAIEVSAEL